MVSSARAQLRSPSELSGTRSSSRPRAQQGPTILVRSRVPIRTAFGCPQASPRGSSRKAEVSSERQAIHGTVRQTAAQRSQPATADGSTFRTRRHSQARAALARFGSHLAARSSTRTRSSQERGATVPAESLPGTHGFLVKKSLSAASTNATPSLPGPKALSSRPSASSIMRRPS